MYGEDLIVSNVHEVRIDGAGLIHTDIMVGNGVIHGINQLLLARTVSSHAFRGRLRSSQIQNRDAVSVTSASRHASRNCLPTVRLAIKISLLCQLSAFIKVALVCDHRLRARY